MQIGPENALQNTLVKQGCLDVLLSYKIVSRDTAEGYYIEQVALLTGHANIQSLKRSNTP